MICILDYGSQYTKLIARSIRRLSVYCEIHHPDSPKAEALTPSGIILSGGPNSVYEEGAPGIPGWVFERNVPVLGICYGMQAMAIALGGTVAKTESREYGRTLLSISESRLFRNIGHGDVLVWMSHGDSVTLPPDGWQVMAVTSSGVVAAMCDESRKLYGLQFHPEVSHTQHGSEILDNFLSVCGCSKAWDTQSMLAEAVERTSNKGDVLCGLSGGVDSSVVAAILEKAEGTTPHCVLVDTGLMRHDEASSVKRMFDGHFEGTLHVEDVSDLFFKRLEGVTDPEKKRKIIGHTFIEVFKEASQAHEECSYLAQGTLYPDVIESAVGAGHAQTIKSHHNVGGLPDELGFELVEPLRMLFKDEVREVGRELGLPAEIVGRHPFPGPGLAIRVLGEVTRERVRIVREADHIFITMLHESNLYDQVWQAFAVLLPVKTVGVMGDQRTYDNVVALRAVTSVDGMTADRANLPVLFLGRVSDRIINEVRGVNRVVYDVTSKPPGTIEWE